MSLITFKRPTQHFDEISFPEPVRMIQDIMARYGWQATDADIEWALLYWCNGRRYPPLLLHRGDITLEFVREVLKYLTPVEVQAPALTEPMEHRQITIDS
jgi:hypothetical protein